MNDIYPEKSYLSMSYIHCYYSTNIIFLLFEINIKLNESIWKIGKILDNVLQSIGIGNAISDNVLF